MNDITVLGWFAIVLVIVFELMTTIVFLYQRTVRKLSYKLETNQRVLVFLYPQYLLLMYQISFLKWPLYIYLLFVNWILVVGILVFTFMLTALLPVIDWFHLLIMRKMLKKSYFNYYISISKNLHMPCVRPVFIDNYEKILQAIDDALVQTGYELQHIEEYKVVKEFAMLADEALIRLLTAKKNLFYDAKHAAMHISQIRKHLDSFND